MAKMTTQNSDNALKPTTQPQGTGSVGLVAVAQPVSCEALQPIHILRLPEVMKRVSICRASIYQYMAVGSFPKSVSLGARSVGWLEHEIDAWLTAKIQARKN